MDVFSCSVIDVGRYHEDLALRGAGRCSKRSIWQQACIGITNGVEIVLYQLLLDESFDRG